MIKIIRAALSVIYLLLIAAIGTLVCLLRPFHPDNTRIFARIYSWGGRVLVGLKIKVTGWEKIKNLGPAVYVVNHQDNLDLFVTGAAVPPRTVTVGKKSLKLLPLFGQLYWLAGNVFIDRNNRSKSSETLSASTEALQNKNTSIWVFPEGTRNKGKNIQDFKHGAFKMAIEAQVPIVPICVSSYVANMDLAKLHAGEARLEFLEPIETKGMSLEDCDKLKSDVWELMSSKIKSLDSETYGQLASNI